MSSITPSQTISEESGKQTASQGVQEGDHRLGWVNFVLKLGQLLVTSFLFLVALYLMSGSFTLFGEGFAAELVAITANPFISLFIGLLATAVIQSSSTVTTLIVALVASGEVSLVNAVPIIIGSNVGTSITSTIVALGHIRDREEYGLAVAGASMHDFFNIISVLILFTLEVSTGLLSTSAAWLAERLSPYQGEIIDSAIFFVQDTANWILSVLGSNPYITLPIGLLLLFFSLQYLSKVLRSLLVGSLEQAMNRYIFGQPIVSLLTGLGATVAVQSSSVTTSLMVPLIATRKVSLERAFPFLMGANIGTTTTAVMAAWVLTGSAATAALACAFAHLIFNLGGVLFLFPIHAVRNIPIRLAESLGKLSSRNRLYGIGYVVIIFFIIPFLLITLTT